MSTRLRYVTYNLYPMFSFWRPLKTVDDWPLALCDGSTMSYDELLGVDLIRRDYVGSTMYAKYKPGYKWYYLEKQKPSEVCLYEAQGRVA
jgi:hypothetical protein